MRCRGQEYAFLFWRREASFYQVRALWWCVNPFTSLNLSVLGLARPHEDSARRCAPQVWPRGDAPGLSTLLLFLAPGGVVLEGPLTEHQAFWVLQILFGLSRAVLRGDVAVGWGRVVSAQVWLFWSWSGDGDHWAKALNRCSKKGVSCPTGVLGLWLLNSWLKHAGCFESLVACGLPLGLTCGRSGEWPSRQCMALCALYV